MSDPSRVLFVSRYWPELIGSAPFSTDTAEWLAAHGRPTTVVSGLPHYPHDDAFPVAPDDPPGFAEAGIQLADDSSLRQELGREFVVEAHCAKPRILGHLMDRLDAVVAK